MAQILVVDDEVGIRELPDLVLLDIWMPDADGITLLKEWATGGQLTMPVIMMSGHGTIDTAVEATRIGAMDFLEKPIALQKLLATVKRALRAGESRAVMPLSIANFGRRHSGAAARRKRCDAGALCALSAAAQRALDRCGARPQRSVSGSAAA